MVLGAVRPVPDDVERLLRGRLGQAQRPLGEDRCDLGRGIQRGGELYRYLDGRAFQPHSLEETGRSDVELLESSREVVDLVVVAAEA